MEPEPEVSPRLSAPVAVLIGVLAVAAALAAGHVVAGLVGPSASPFLGVGNTAIDLAPTPVKDWAIATFGTNDKLVLMLGMAVVLLLLAGLAGLLSRRRSWPGVTLAAAVGVLGFLAVLARPDLGQLGILAPAASLITGVLVLRWLHGLALARAGADTPTDDSRRVFLRTSAGVAVGAGVLGGGGQLLAVRVDVEGSRAAVGPLTAADPAPPVPQGADFAPNGTPRFLTSNRDFYRIDTALTVPRLRAEDWRLRIHGLVDREVSFDFSDIRNRRLVERPVTLTCVSNEVGGDLISNANWIGVPLRELLMAAGVKPGADQLMSTSVDGFTAGTPVDALLDPDRGALLAIGMNGEPLPVEHGFPARMVVPGLYGYVSATKWVTDMELTRFDRKEGYWIPRGWAQKAPIKTQSRIDSPRRDAAVPAGRLVVAGVAWAQPVGVGRVEVRLDEGQWQQAELATEVSPHSWRMWRATVEVSRGEHRVEVRATDRTGRTQTEQFAPPAPDGATGWHSVPFSAS
ncbi:MAG TPA: molybdopterin-dependent oxidoreductase [Actinophytocola sp.]|uniref:molybdopterin-dependent oxidoreductase n=1 Tax=Actinophytocola sp. TaxID=1872138 RepID=UPI002DDC9FF1|nr:molybdopterin-dependent oxidoreductase [Actinophytocola sp.]HEV2779485.1 molybdopterin-dependent oxidoreductase [Actinophytocola sp.]